MYLKRGDINTTAVANGGSDFSTNCYWSSTENDNGYAWVQLFGNGDQSNSSKDSLTMCVLFGLFSYLIQFSEAVSQTPFKKIRRVRNLISAA